MKAPSRPCSASCYCALSFFVQSIKYCIFDSIVYFQLSFFAASRSAIFSDLLSFLDARLNIFDAISDFCGVSSEGGRVRLFCSASIASGRLQHGLLR